MKPVKVYPFKGTLNIWCELNYLHRVGSFFIFAYVTIFYTSLLVSEVLQEVLARTHNETNIKPKKYRAPTREHLRLKSKCESWQLNSKLWKTDLGCDFLSTLSPVHLRSFCQETSTVYLITPAFREFRTKAGKHTPNINFCLFYEVCCITQ